MKKEDKKDDRIPCCPKTKQRLKKYYVTNEFKNYDNAVNYLLDKIEKSEPKNKNKQNGTKKKSL